MRSLWRDEAQGLVRQVATCDQPLVVLFGEHGADEPNDEHIPGAELHMLPDEGHISIGLRLPKVIDDLLARMGR